MGLFNLFSADEVDSMADDTLAAALLRASADRLRDRADDADQASRDDHTASSSGGWW